MGREDNPRGKMSLAAVRVRGRVEGKKVRDTLKMLNLTTVNDCVVVPNNPQYAGMLKKCSNFITYGEVNPETLEELIRKRGRTKGDKKVTDDYVKNNSEFRSIKDLAKKVVNNKATIKDIKGLKVTFRLRPPKKGWERGGIKEEFPKGALGYRGEEINKLLERMI